MRRLITAVAALTSASIAVVATPAAAETYRVCLDGGGALHCDYANLDQCRASASGTGGSCVMNPEASGPGLYATYPAPAKRHRGETMR